MKYNRREIIRAVLFTFIFLFLLLGADQVSAASLYFSPRSDEWFAGRSFTVIVFVSSPNQAINAVSGAVSFDNTILEVISLEKSGSIITLWVQEPIFSNREGTARFEGIVLNPGFTGGAGKVIAITFRAKTTGNTEVNFSSGSVLANDGRGTGVLESLGKGNYIVKPAPKLAPGEAAEFIAEDLPPKPVVKSPTHPDENKWYRVDDLELSWELPRGVDGVSYAISSKPNYRLPPSNKGLISKLSYDLKEFRDGTWYFFARFRNASGWGPVIRRTVKIDRTPPAPFSIIREDINDPTNPQPIFGWQSEDLAAGLAFYETKIGDGDWFNADVLKKSSYILPLQAPAERKLIARAYDNAGNFTESALTFTVEPIPIPIITYYSEKINSPKQALIVRGEAGSNFRINLYLRDQKNLITFSAPTDNRGRWSAEYKDRIPSGLWELKAQAVDSRGALSRESPAVTVPVGGWVADFIRFLVEWGAVAAGILVVGGLIILLYHFIVHHVRLQRAILKKELWKFRKELYRDLKVLEKDLESAKEKDAKLDLSPAAQRKEKQQLKKDLVRLEEDVSGEIKKIDDLSK